MNERCFVSILGIALMLVGCDHSQESRSDGSRGRPASKSRKQEAENTGARVALGASGPSISASDWDAIYSFREFAKRWNDAAAPFVRDYLDPNVPADRWVREASQHVKELRSVHIEMYARTVAIEDAGIRGTLEDMTANYRTKLDCLTRIHIAVAQGNAEAEQQAQQDLSNAATEG